MSPNPGAVLKALETTIKKVSRDIRQQDSASSEKLDSLTKMTNAYSRLLERSETTDLSERSSDGDYDGTVMVAPESR